MKMNAVQINNAIVIIKKRNTREIYEKKSIPWKWISLRREISFLDDDNI
jgi:hypothetical protein